MEESDKRVRIRITATPPGDAPELVRDAWIGLVLPLAPGETGHRSMVMGSVLEPELGLFAFLWRLLTGQLRRGQHYIVPVAEAVEILERHAPFAAGWWRANTPHLLQPGQCFGFAATVCEIVRDGEFQ